jgi:hypothetical protein
MFDVKLRPQDEPRIEFYAECYRHSDDPDCPNPDLLGYHYDLIGRAQRRERLILDEARRRAGRS